MLSRFIGILPALIAFAFGGVLNAWSAPTAAPSAEPERPAVTMSSAQAPYTGVWVDDSATLDDATVQQVLAGVAEQQPDPQHIVVLVHGFDTPRSVSARQYETLSKALIVQYEKLGQRVAVVGLQWDSDVGPTKAWIGRVVKSTLGLSGDNPYFRKVVLAGNVGATAGRHMILALQDRFKSAHIDIFAHSLGCDVTRNILRYDLKEKLKNVAGAPEPTQPYAPGTPISLNLVALAGADIDADLVYRNETKIERRGSAALFWITTGGVRNPDMNDLVLSMRGIMRGTALGNSLPRLHRDQIDMLCATRRIVFDGTDIPRLHGFLQYYNEARLSRAVSAAVALTDSTHHSKLLDTLDAVLKAPADPKTLAKFFDRRDLTVTYYTLWRLENILCGGPRHLSDGYLRRVGLMLTDDPQDIENERWAGPCEVVRQGWWPPKSLVMDAITKRSNEAGKSFEQGGFTFGR